MQTEELQASCLCVNISNPFIRESYMMIKMFPDITSEIHSVLASFIVHKQTDFTLVESGVCDKETCLMSFCLITSVSWKA